MNRNDLTAQRLRELLHFNCETGVFTRLVATAQRSKIGDIAGSIHSSGYVHIKILGECYKAHRLAWLYVYGTWPIYEIDHIDGNPGNNSIANLRDIPHKINAQNMRSHSKTNKVGLLGVSKGKRGKNWCAQIGIDGEIIHIGTFQTPHLAHAAYLEKKREIHVGCTI
jgi:hypothetical protein